MNYEEKIKELFKDSYIEVNKNHDEAVIAFSNYCNITGNKIPLIVNYDSHSDIHLNMKQAYSTIANWVNYSFEMLDITEYYWIIPNYITRNPQLKSQFSNNKKFNQETFQTKAMHAYGGFDDVLREELFFNKETYELLTIKKLDIINQKNRKFGLPEITPESAGLKRIFVYMVPFDKISVLSGKTIALSVDADSFCNTGFDTFNVINNLNISKVELIQEFKFFIDSLYNNNIKIAAASLTRSPAYFPSKFENEINEFFNFIKSASLFSLDKKVKDESISLK